MRIGEIRVNGACEPYAATVSALLRAKNLEESKGLAVAVNDAVVAKSAWATTRLEPGDAVEIVRAVGGG